jgi:hypothetical protein
LPSVDLAVRAVIVMQWLGDEIASAEGRDGRALAALVRGVFDLAGRRGLRAAGSRSSMVMFLKGRPPG